jgi:hypothetical protein
MTRGRALVAMVVLGLLAVPACGRGHSSDNAYRLHLTGRATIVHANRTTTAGSGDHRLAAGDTVHMVTGGAVLDLPGDRSMLLRARGRSATVVKLGAVTDIVDGDAVVQAGGGAHFTAGDVDVRMGAGAARVQRGLSVTVAMYRGTASVRSAGRSLAGGLPGLRQVSVPATGLLPRDPTPLVYDDAKPDPWDLQFLGDAIDLGTRLDGRARGFTGQIGPRARVDASLLRRVLPPLTAESAFGDDLVAPTSSPGESLVGAAIVVESGAGSFVARWNDVFTFRNDGARWGLVALDQKVKRDALLSRLDDAFGRSPLLFAATPPRTSPTTTRGSTSTTSPTGRSTTTTTTTTRPPTVPALTIPPTTIGPLTIGPVTAPPSGGAQAPPTPSGATTPVDIVQQLVDGLLGGAAPGSTGH